MSEPAPGWRVAARRVLRRLFHALFNLWPFAFRAGLESALADEEGRRGFDADERAMLQNVLRLRARTLADVMVPRENIIAVPATASLETLIALFCRAPHSRLPVYRDTLDEPAGMIHIRDALAEWRKAPGQASITELMREPLFAPPQMPVADLLRRMQKARTHIALVVDEHGGICGLVSIEDLVEEIVGEIEDEHDPQVLPLKASAGQMKADGQTPLEEIERALGVEIAAREEARSLGGWIAAKLGRVPKTGEKLHMAESALVIEILKSDARRVHRAALRRKAHKESKAGAKNGGHKNAHRRGRKFS